MLSTIFKKKYTDQQLSNIFVNGIVKIADTGFDEVKSMIEEDPAFISKPELETASNGHFVMIVIVGNIKLLSNSFLPEQEANLLPLIFSGFSNTFQIEEEKFKKYFDECVSFMSHINHPSKVVLYSMSKALFYKYKLNAYQEDYFKNMNTPNPLFLKRMDEVMKNFLWNWDAFFKRHKVQSHS